MTFAELKTELAARGFTDLSDTRRGTYINAARAELDRMFLWPWRQKSSSSASTVALSDFGPIERVLDSTRDVSLQPVDYQSLTDGYGDLSIAGTPWAYYVVWTSGTATVTPFPTTSNTLEVRYYRTTADLSAAGDTPVAPAEAHYLIVDLAVRRAYRDQDSHDRAGALQSEIDRTLGELLIQYPPGLADGPDAYVGVRGESDDW